MKNPVDKQKIYSVSVIVPCRNEKKYIVKFLDNLLNQCYDNIFLEIIVADGMSNDGTRELLQEYCLINKNVRMIDNWQGIVSTGLNEAISQANGDIIVRMDVHTEYDQDYIQKCINILLITEADNVGGPWRAKGKTYLQKAIAIAFQSPFSSGGAHSHNLDTNGLVDSVYLGCWWKKTLFEVGLFDEELVRNQDDELNLRLIRSGKKVWQSSDIKSYYYPRSSLIALFKQYAQYGYWKIRVIKKHRLPASMRHLIPGLFLGSLLVSGFGSMVSLWMSFVFILILSTYGIVILIASVVTCRRDLHWCFFPVMPFIFSAFHLGYGYGFLRGIWNFIILKRRGENSFTKITRSST